MARMIFVLSSERSGSTLLSAMLGQHPLIIAPSELWLLQFEDYAQWRSAKKVAVQSLEEFFDCIGRPMPAARIDDNCSRLSIPQVYDWLLSFLDKETYLVDKTPGYANDSKILSRTERFEPFYIWLLRHPLGVVDSKVRLLERGPKYKGLGGVFRRLQDGVARRRDRGMTTKARKRERKWVRQNTNIMSFLDQIPKDRKTKVVFEELVRSPDRVTKGLCKSIGVAFVPAMSAPETGTRVMPPGLGNPNFHTRSTIVPDTALAWTARYREDALEQSTLELMDAVGVPNLRELKQQA